ncbi:MAG: AAA family ATPase [Desulfobacterales bacterium]|jgi:general secretion pathway protein A
MYEEYFGFKEKPFNVAPDPDYLYLSRKHQNAITSLDFGLVDDAGLILFTGDIGTGKTTLIHHILRKIGVEFTVAVVFNTNVDADQLLGIILQEFGLNADSDNKAAAIKTLSRFLIDLRSRNKRPLLIIDEAQSLSLDALEEIRLLSNLQDETTMLLQIMLVGQPELKDKLKSPSMASFTQRIAVNYHLKPFELEETAQYIAHRLKTAGGRTDLFTDAAIDRVHRMTRGIPRSINILCHAALVYGFADDLTIIDVPVLEEIMSDTQDSGIGSERWAKDSDEGADSDRGGKKALLPSEPAKPVSQENRPQLEVRIEALEARLEDYTKELREALKVLLHKERSRNDKLLMAYAQLKTKYDALKEELTHPDRPPAGARENGNTVKPLQGEKRFTLVSDSENKDRQR